MRFELTTPGLQEQSSTTALFLQREIAQKIVVKSLSWGSWVRISLKSWHFTLKFGFLKIFKNTFLKRQWLNTICRYKQRYGSYNQKEHNHFYCNALLDWLIATIIQCLINKVRSFSLWGHPKTTLTKKRYIGKYFTKC